MIGHSCTCNTNININIFMKTYLGGKYVSWMDFKIDIILYESTDNSDESMNCI